MYSTCRGGNAASSVSQAAGYGEGLLLLDRQSKVEAQAVATVPKNGIEPLTYGRKKRKEKAFKCCTDHWRGERWYAQELGHELYSGVCWVYAQTDHHRGETVNYTSTYDKTSRYKPTESGERTDL